MKRGSAFRIVGFVPVSYTHLDVYKRQITASVEGRGLVTDVLRDVARQIFIPLTVGGAINTLEDVYKRQGRQCGAGHSYGRKGGGRDGHLQNRRRAGRGGAGLRRHESISKRQSHGSQAYITKYSFSILEYLQTSFN